MPTALNVRALKRTDTISIPGQRQIMFFKSATVATVAEVTADGWFNPARDADMLTKDSIIDIVCDINGTVARVVIRIATLPATGNVTTVVDGGLVAT